MLAKLWFCTIRRQHAFRRARKGEDQASKTCARCGAIATVKRRKAKVAE